MTSIAIKRKTHAIRPALLAAAALLVVGAMAGCSKPRATPDVSVKATPSPSPTPRPQQAVTAQAVDVHFTMTDVKGQTVAVVDAKTTRYDPLNGGGMLTAENANTILYEEGKPATRLRAQKISADRNTRVVTATGNVIAESLSHKDTPTVRADRMVWTADSKILTGNGKVLLTMKPDYELPGRSFRADTKLNHFNVKQDERPGRGSL